ncbi:MAG: hypothetical protein CMJ44_17455 [Pimelobacter sp.]|nr:hypothetical protein [Pimelobacter sp.]
MTQTLLGALTLVGVVACLPDWRRRLPWLLSLSLALPASGAVPVAALPLTPYLLVALVIGVLVSYEWMRGALPLTGWPGSALLLGFIGWAALITLAGPALFSGTTVLNTSGGGGLVAPNPLGYSGSNLAQVAYFVISALVIIWFANRERLSPHLLLPGLYACMGMSTWRLLSEKAGLPFPGAIVDNSTRAYIDEPGNYRLRGVFTEPSTLAHYSIATLAFCAVMLFARSRGRQLRGLYLLLGALAAVNIVFSRSGTGVIGGGLVLVVVVVLIIGRALRSDRGMTAVVISGCGAIVLGLVFSSPILTYGKDVFLTKVDSNSYDQRSFGDRFALSIFLETRGVGVGLGSNQPSSLVPMLLSCVGVIGTLLFAAFVATVVLRSVITPHGLGPATVVISLVVTKSVAGSFLSEPLLMLGIALAVNAITRAREAPVTDRDVAATGGPAPPRSGSTAPPPRLPA